MSTPQAPPRIGPPFPLLGPALAVLVLYAIVVGTLPPNAYRFAVAIAALFATGYCTLALIVGTTVRLAPAEVLAFSVGMTILMTSLSALAVSLFGIPITEFAVLIVGLPIGVVAWYLQRPHGGSLAAVVDGARGLFDFSEYSRSEKTVIAVLLAGVTAALLVILSLSAVHRPDVLSPAVAIVGPGGTPDSLPTTFVVGQPRAITVTVLGGSNTEALTFRIRLVPLNATGNESFHVVPFASPLPMDPFAEYDVQINLTATSQWTQVFSIAIEQAGSYTLRFELVDAKAAVVASNRLPVTAL
jgi:uncharacterized membrane protein